MTLETIRVFLGWCSVMNFALLLLWFLGIVVAGDWIYRFHSKFFRLSVEEFHSTHYRMMGYFKLTVIILNVVPYLVLRIVF